LLVLVPWSSFWTRNYFASLLPWIGAVMANDFVRGAVSGLGVLNIVAGMAELLSLLGGRRR
jgi:hypothetical protein